MSTPFTDSNAWYGGYVSKKYPMVFASKVRELEESHNDLSTRAQMAEGEIDRAHTVLDGLDVPRLQENGLPYSLEGRLRVMVTSTPPLAVRLDRRVMRYFLFAYTWEGATKSGNGNLWLERETFPSNDMLKEAASKLCPEKAAIIITTWNEFETEQDYRAFTGA